MNKVYDIVQEAQKIGLKTANAGVTCGQVDAVCRNLIAERGYEKLFIHSTGHGIGLDVHEPPWIRMKNDEELRANMAITIEPGVYIENKFGVRRSEEHTSELQSRQYLVCRLLLEKKTQQQKTLK